MTKQLEKPKRVQLSRRRGWRMPPNTIKVDRTTQWGNPFVVRPSNQQGGWYACLTVKEAVQAFREHLPRVGFLLTNSIKGWEISQADIRRELRGKNLACWCKIGTPCHADVLLEIANA